MEVCAEGRLAQPKPLMAQFPPCKQLLGSHRPLLPGTCTESSSGQGNDCASQLTTRTLFPNPAFSSRKGACCSLPCCKSTVCVCLCVCVKILKNIVQHHWFSLEGSWNTQLCLVASKVLPAWKQILPKVTSSQWLVVQRGSNTVLLLLLNP